MAVEYDFPGCMHALSAGMHLNNIDPSKVTISLPHEEWWKLQCVLERKFNGLMKFDGRGTLSNHFRYMGFTFAAKEKSAAANKEQG